MQVHSRPTSRTRGNGCLLTSVLFLANFFNCLLSSLCKETYSRRGWGWFGNGNEKVRHSKNCALKCKAAQLRCGAPQGHGHTRDTHGEFFGQIRLQVLEDRSDVRVRDQKVAGDGVTRSVVFENGSHLQVVLPATARTIMRVGYVWKCRRLHLGYTPRDNEQRGVVVAQKLFALFLQNRGFL